MKDKITKILELIGVSNLEETSRFNARRTIEGMVEALQNEDLAKYAELQTGLFEIMGVNLLKEKQVLNESEIQDISDKIRALIDTLLNGSTNMEFISNKNFDQTLDEAKRLYEFYFKSGQASKDIDKISADDFHWKHKVNEQNAEFLKGKEKMKIMYYDQNTMMTKDGKKLTADMITKLVGQGYILMPMGA